MRVSGRLWRGVGVALALLVVMLTAWAGAAGRLSLPLGADSPAGAAASPRVGALAPDFQVTDVNTGTLIRLSALRGRPVWINFWATWCEECKTELPTMKQLYDKYKGRGLALVGVTLREDPAQVQSFMKIQGYDWISGIDPDTQLWNRYDTVGIPNHFFVDAGGIIRATSLGHLLAPEMVHDLATILGD